VKAFVFSQAVDELGRVFAQMKPPDQSGLSYRQDRGEPIIANFMVGVVDEAELIELKSRIRRTYKIRRSLLFVGRL
jgi:hypothetical protein